jgi:general secretion pathway protein A
MLLGQPELKEKLAQEELRQLRQRILVHYELRPFTREEMDHYVHHRLTLAGGMGRPRFTPWALRQIYKTSRGIPRIINNLCDKALLAAFIRDSDEVTYWDARRATKDLERLTD